MNDTKTLRNSSIELLKTAAMLLIVLNHVVQSLSMPIPVIADNSYLIDLSRASGDMRHIILAMLSYSGLVGNTLFFVCTAWFMLESRKTSGRKILGIILNVFIVSVIFFLVVYIIRGGDIESAVIIKQFFPLTFANNWYMTCYVLFCLISPYLNGIIDKMDKPTLLRAALVFAFLYLGINFVHLGHYYISPLVIWISVYFLVAYMKYYLPELSSSIRVNIIAFLIGFAGNSALILLTDLLGLRFGFFEYKLQYWRSDCDPFVILMCIALFNIARSRRFENRFINRISKLSLLVYITHENMLIRTYYRPLIWQYVYKNFGYSHIFLWISAITLAIFAVSLIVSCAYQCLLGKAVDSLCGVMHKKITSSYKKLEEKILRLQ